MSIWNISSCAKDIIRKNHEKHDIISVYELLSHDGYDIDGPESDIYDLFVIVKNNDMSGIYEYYHYHRENWFNYDKEDKMYYLEDKQRTSDLIEINNLNDYSKIIFF